MSITQHPTKGPGHWYITLGRGRDRINIPFHGTREEALDYEQAERRKRGKTIATADPRLREISEDYLRTYKIDHFATGYERQRRCIDKIIEYFGQYCLSNINPPLIEQYKYMRLTKVKPVTINKELCALSGLFKWARDHNRIDTIPRIKKFPPKLTTAPTFDIPSKTDLLNVLDHTPEKIRGLYRLMFLYGLRSGEARNLRIENINRTARTIWVNGKGGKIRYLPIVDDDTWQELEHRCKNATDGWLWYSPRVKGPYKDIGESLKRAAKKAGLSSNIHPHLLRHGAATELVGITDLRTAQEILGHATITVTEKYLHVRKERLHNALTSHAET